MKYLISMFLCLLISSVNAKSTSDNHYPADLLYLGKPIDPLCFFNMEEGEDSNQIQLANCGIAKENYIIKDKNNNLIQQGFFGFDWQDKDASHFSQGYSYYKFFPADNHQFWIYTVNSGGGSGDFTGISLVKRKNSNTLEINKMVGGDRCNGGVQNVKEKNHQLSYSVNLTAYDVIALENESSLSLKAYDDLAACAVCCVAKAFYTVDVKLQPKLNYVVLNEIKDTSEMPDQGNNQSCFNTVFASYVKQGKTKLDPSQLQSFVNEFKGVCVK